MASAPKPPSLYSRIQAHGTLTEEPRDVPDARFALPSTIHWMRALAILVADLNVDFGAGRTFYARVQARSVPERELNTVCEQLLFVLNQIAALRALCSAPNKADVARTAIVTWYYGVYSAASAMTAAMDGSFQDNHTETARKWQERFPANRLAMPPFADCLSSVLPATANAELVPISGEGAALLRQHAIDAAGGVGLLRGVSIRHSRLGAVERRGASEGDGSLQVSFGLQY
ncbi:hypothetical protein ABIF69_003256 [Bradyrhizobium japonicum]